MGVPSGPPKWPLFDPLFEHPIWWFRACVVHFGTHFLTKKWIKMGYFRCPGTPGTVPGHLGMTHFWSTNSKDSRCLVPQKVVISGVPEPNSLRDSYAFLKQAKFNSRNCVFLPKSQVFLDTKSCTTHLESQLCAFLTLRCQFLAP